MSLGTINTIGFGSEPSQETTARYVTLTLAVTVMSFRLWCMSCTGSYGTQLESANTEFVVVSETCHFKLREKDNILH